MTNDQPNKEIQKFMTSNTHHMRDIMESTGEIDPIVAVLFWDTVKTKPLIAVVPLPNLEDAVSETAKVIVQPMIKNMLESHPNLELLCISLTSCAEIRMADVKNGDPMPDIKTMETHQGMMVLYESNEDAIIETYIVSKGAMSVNEKGAVTDTKVNPGMVLKESNPENTVGRLFTKFFTKDPISDEPCPLPDFN